MEAIIRMLVVNIAYFVCKCRYLNTLLILLAMRYNYSLKCVIKCYQCMRFRDSLVLLNVFDKNTPGARFSKTSRRKLSPD